MAADVATADPKLSFNLQALLEQLCDEELSKFKSQLGLFAQQHELQDVPQAEMTEASAKDLVEILTTHCPPAWVERVAVNIFENINRADLAKTVEEELTEDIYRKMVLKKFQRLWANNFWPGEYKKSYLLTESYRSLLRLCDPLRRPGLLGPRTVVLQGPTGAGKTTLVKRLILDWAEGRLGPAFQWAHYLSCKELRHHRVKNLHQLLFEGLPDMNKDVLRALLGAAEVLLVVDGFDELRYGPGEMIRGISTHWGQRKPVPVLLSSLLKRILLPNATLLVTTRPRALQELLLLLEQPVLVNVDGFSETETWEYFRRHFGDQAQAQRALAAVWSNEALLAMSRMPAACRLLCACLKPLLEGGEDPAAACHSPTALILRFLHRQLRPRGPAPAAQLETLCCLAAHMLTAQQSTFHTGDLKRLGMQEGHLQPFLTNHIIQKDWGCRWCYHFVHSSVQQLLAALFYILKPQDREGQGRQPSSRDREDVRKLLSREARARNPDLAQAGRFLFGLLNRKRAQELEAAFGCHIDLEIRRELLGCGAEESRPFLLRMEQSEVFSWLYESQDEELAAEALAPFEEMSVILKSRQDLLHASFCLKNCPGLRRLTVQVARGLFPEDGVQLPSTAQGHRPEDDQVLLALWTDLCAMFFSNQNLNRLDIHHSCLSYSSVAVLCEHLASAYSLQEVVLSNISPAEAQLSLCSCLCCSEALVNLTLQGDSHRDLLPLLSQVLIHPKCHLQDLRLGACSATFQQWADFFLTIQASPLTGLDLSNNEILDRGATLLCETLRRPECILQKLTLENCGLTRACCEDFLSTLIVSQQLTHLSLANNDLGDDGVKILCEGLNHSNCQLQSLVLWHCNVGSDGCVHLSQLLQQGASLKYLDLGLNQVGDSGMRALCQALKSPQCGLKCLWLWGCSITSTSCEELSEALLGNQRLVTLDLGQNTLAFDGLMLLYTALQFQRCSLQILRLKINEANPEVKKLIKTIQNVNPQLIVDSDHQNPRKRRPEDFPA
ncbi:NACHT, LRR and PYD domains-containing protein 2 [Dipodomys spectabilis]|uniref:NACHT, LRR and PYD domains-containing protein 2 n=1 Tax=Dipodomys spectabilis TaxID=105255 RepID=UPI001C5462FC|nr:NACHT, LRR and PYD domains-containing protein 2 [Dipodomys spectabilis]